MTTVYAITRVLFWCLFPSLLRNSGNKKQNNPFVSTTVRLSSTYIILYIKHQENVLLTKYGIDILPPLIVHADSVSHV